MRSLAPASVAVVLMAAACGTPVATDAGWVIAIDSSSVTAIESFTLRDQDGLEVQYHVGPLELDGGAFPASHLREHMALAQPVAVAYRLDGEARVATRLVDAPWLQP